jgi:hypothetical protein
MGRRRTTSPAVSRLSGLRTSVLTPGIVALARHRVILLSGVAILGGLALVVFREGSPDAALPGHAPIAAVARPGTARPDRPPLTRAEEAYIAALWPIHGDVERSTVRLSLGKIFYKTADIEKPQLKARADHALATYRRARERMGALQPPPSLEREHNDYLAAIELFERSTLEVLKMFDDGDENHLLAAYPPNQQGADMIRVVGAKFWRNEFSPH